MTLLTWYRVRAKLNMERVILVEMSSFVTCTMDSIQRFSFLCSPRTSLLKNLSGTLTSIQLRVEATPCVCVNISISSITT
jgi:hypothetical protein